MRTRAPGMGVTSACVLGLATAIGACSSQAPGGSASIASGAPSVSTTPKSTASPTSFEGIRFFDNVPPDWKTYHLPGDDFSVSLPPTWKVVEVTPALIAAIAEQGAKALPDAIKIDEAQLKDMIKQSGTALFAFDTASRGTGGLYTVLTVAVVAKPGMTLPNYAAYFATQLNQQYQLITGWKAASASAGDEVGGEVDYDSQISGQRVWLYHFFFADRYHMIIASIAARTTRRLPMSSR
jgi:hypothetical protein